MISDKQLSGTTVSSTVEITVTDRAAALDGEMVECRVGASGTFDSPLVGSVFSNVCLLLARYHTYSI